MLHGGILPNKLAFNLNVFHNRGSAPCCCLGKVQGCASQMGLHHWAMGCLLTPHGLGEHAHGANGGTTIAAPPLNTALRTRVAWAASSP